MPDGRPRTVTSSYVELGSGLHRWDAQARAWVDAEAVIEIAGTGAAATKGAHGVTFAANANTRGCIDLVTPDGKRLRSHLLGIAWFDAKTGKSEMIGELKNSIGELHHPNVVIYPDAFDGLKADLRYTYRLGSFEQDVILREKPALPDGFAPDTTRLEVWTEFIEHPGGVVTQKGRAGMTDDSLDFGTIQTSPGNAFGLDPGRKDRRGLAIAKRWLTAEGRTFLVEAVRYQAAKRELNKLPPATAQAVPRRAWPEHPAGRAFPDAPAPRQARANQPEEKMRMAALPINSGRASLPASRDPKTLPGSADAWLNPEEKAATTNAAVSSPSPLGGERAEVRGVVTNASVTPPTSPLSPRPGFVLDYILSSSLTNFTFQNDTTYTASNTVNLYGTTVFEGGCVLKFAPTNIATLSILGSVTWRTESYRPAVFTAVDDNSVGIDVGTGSPSGFYGGDYLLNASTVEHARFSYARNAVRVALGGITARHCQFVRCERALESDDAYATAPPAITMENVLFYTNQYAVTANAYLVGRHITAHDCYMMWNGAGSAGEMHNSLFVSSGGWSGVDPEFFDSETVATDTGVFQTVGGAAHYLAPGSPHRNAGGALSGALAGEIKLLTTYPPIVFSNTTFTADTTLFPQAQRDSDIPDRGYHYDPLDYAFGGAHAEVNLTVGPGTAVGWFRTESGWYHAGHGLHLGDTKVLTFDGRAEAPNYWVRCSVVQEGGTGLWDGGYGPGWSTTIIPFQ